MCGMGLDDNSPCDIFVALFGVNFYIILLLQYNIQNKVYEYIFFTLTSHFLTILLNLF